MQKLVEKKDSCNDWQYVQYIVLSFVDCSAVKKMFTWKSTLMQYAVSMMYFFESRLWLDSHCSTFAKILICITGNLKCFVYGGFVMTSHNNNFCVSVYILWEQTMHISLKCVNALNHYLKCSGWVSTSHHCLGKTSVQL